MAAVTFIAPRLDDTAQRLLWKIANFLYVGLGGAGSVAVVSGTLYQGAYWIFHAKTASVIASISYEGGTGGAVAGDTIAAGDRIYGKITSLQLTSGTGELYNAAIP